MFAKTVGRTQHAQPITRWLRKGLARTSPIYELSTRSYHPQNRAAVPYIFARAQSAKQRLPTSLLQRRFQSSDSTRSSNATPARHEHSTPTQYAHPHRAAPLPHRRNPDEPIYELTFTCKKCSNRSSHTVSKQGYHSGTVLITCPGCHNRHLISDHLKIFSDKSVTLEDIMRDSGELVRKGLISPEGDVEFWKEEDGDGMTEAKDAQQAQLGDGKAST